jgi:putative peptide zinc metalloprotease protein
MLATRRSIQILVATLLALMLVAGAAPAALAQDDSAVAINEEDGSSIFKLAFHIRRITDEVVDPTNLALAYSSCENCRTVAISIQVVLVASDPQIVAPENLALAVNFECTLCETFASAHQFVLGVDDDFRLSGRARRAITRIHKQLRDLRDSDLSIPELDAEVQRIVDELFAIIKEEIAAHEDDDDDEDGDGTDDTDDDTDDNTDGDAVDADVDQSPSPDDAGNTPVQEPSDSPTAPPSSEATSTPTP